MVNTLLEIMYIICGLVLVICGVYALNDSANPKKIGTAAFWIIFGIIFMAGPYMNPALVGALLLVMGGLTAGYCGTLMTPMAANFNIVPASILEMENKNGIILVQAPVAITLLLIHIVLMYILAF